MKKIEELKTTHCGYFLLGTCRFADKCRLMHQEEEKELVRMEKKVKELFEKSQSLPYGSTKRSSKEEGQRGRCDRRTRSKPNLEFTNTSFYTQKLLLREALKQSSFYTHTE